MIAGGVHIPVSEANHKTELRRVVLALVLDDEAVTTRVVSFAFAATTPLRLVALVIGLVLHETCGGHRKRFP